MHGYFVQLQFKGSGKDNKTALKAQRVIAEKVLFLKMNLYQFHGWKPENNIV
jgi:hypothetical protein